MLENIEQISGSINTPEKITGTIDSTITITGSINNQEQGLSAYQIAMANGFEGDEQSWLQSLKGKAATINGFNTIEIIEGNNVTIEQNNNKLKINAIGGVDVDLSDYALESDIPTNISELNNDAGYLTSVPSAYKTKTENDELYQPKGNYLTSEADPTVPSHVKSITQQNINDWNNKSNFSGSYNDLTNKPTIPTKTSDLQNDSGFITQSYVDSEISNIDLSDYALESDIPTNISELNNDAGYLTSVPNTYKTKTENDELYQSKGNYLTSETDPTVPSHVKLITQQNITNWNNKSEFSGSYNDLTNKPTIPTKTSDLTNDSDFATKSYVDNKIFDVDATNEIEISDTEPTNEDTKIWINSDGVMRFKNGTDWQGTVSAGGNTEPIGTTKMYFGATEPNGYKFLNGQAISRTEYSELFSLIGTTYGEGDGTTTFNLPDMGGRVPVGLNVNKEWFDQLGKTGGSEEVTLTIQQIPSHNHLLGWGNTTDLTVPGQQGIPGTGPDMQASWATSFTGGGQAHTNLQPYMTVNYIIKVKNISSAPDESVVIGADDTPNDKDVYSSNAVNEIVNDLNTYSTTEKKIGIWIDGKPIYEKTINSTVANIQNEINNIGIDTLIYHYGWAQSNYNHTWLIPNQYNAESGYISNISKSVSDNSIGINFGSFYSDTDPAFMILKYTKTTD